MEIYLVIEMAIQIHLTSSSLPTSPCSSNYQPSTIYCILKDKDEFSLSDTLTAKKKSHKQSEIMTWLKKKHPSRLIYNGSNKANLFTICVLE